MIGPLLSWTVSTEGLTAEKVAQLHEGVSETIRKLMGDSCLQRTGAATSPEGGEVDRVNGWSRHSYAVFLQRLRDEGASAQADVLEVAVAKGGVIDRAEAYEAAGWDPTRRSLKGFTRPINRIVADMRRTGLLGNDAPRPLHPVYGSTRKGYQRARSFSVPADLLPVFGRARIEDPK